MTADLEARQCAHADGDAGEDIGAVENQLRRRAVKQKSVQETAHITDDGEDHCQVPLTVAALSPQGGDQGGDGIGQQRQSGEKAQGKSKVDRGGKAARQQQIEKHTQQRSEDRRRSEDTDKSGKDFFHFFHGMRLPSKQVALTIHLRRGKVTPRFLICPPQRRERHSTDSRVQYLQWI